jgi:hypothetical protein
MESLELILCSLLESEGVHKRISPSYWHGCLLVRRFLTQNHSDCWECFSTLLLFTWLTDINHCAELAYSIIAVPRCGTPLLHLCFCHASSVKYTEVFSKYELVLSPPLPTTCITFVLNSTEGSFCYTNFTYITKHIHTWNINLWAGTHKISVQNNIAAHQFLLEKMKILCQIYTNYVSTGMAMVHTSDY